jgi:dynein heavy chain 1
VERYVLRSLITNVIWAFSGDGRLKIRQELSDYVRSITTIALPPQDNVPIIDYEVRPRLYAISIT